MGYGHETSYKVWKIVLIANILLVVIECNSRGASKLVVASPQLNSSSEVWAHKCVRVTLMPARVLEVTMICPPYDCMRMP